MYAIEIDGKIKTFARPPKTWKGQNGYQYATPEQLEEDGFREVVIPKYDPQYQRLGQVIKTENGFSKEVINLSREEIVQNFLNKKEQDGREIANRYNLRAHIDLIGMPIAQLEPINIEIDEVLRPAQAFLKTGDFFSSIDYMNRVSPPTLEPVLTYWNDLKQEVNDYYTNNYPNEPI